MVFNLFGKNVPKTCENFKGLCLGDKGKSKKGFPLCFRNSIFHRVIPNFMAQGGDFEQGNGKGGQSIYGKDFDDENFIYKHNKRGMLAMANNGKNSNGSQFYITFKTLKKLDGKYVVFGECIQGIEVLDKIEAVADKKNKKGTPKEIIKIYNCGIL